jgi:hypothetical protein
MGGYRFTAAFHEVGFAIRGDSVLIDAKSGATASKSPVVIDRGGYGSNGIQGQSETVR